MRHDSVHLAALQQAAIGDQFILVPGPVTSTKPRWLSPWELPWPGKCLSVHLTPLFTVTVDVGGGLRGYYFGVGGKAALQPGNDGLGGVDGHIHHRGQVERHAAISQPLGDIGSLPTGFLQVVVGP